MTDDDPDGLKLRLFDWVRQRIPEDALVDMTFVAALEELVLSEVARTALDQGVARRADPDGAPRRQAQVDGATQPKRTP